MGAPVLIRESWYYTFGDNDPMAVDRYRADLRTRFDKRNARQRVTRIFDPDGFVPSLHNSDNYVDGLLRAGGYDDVFGPASHSARASKSSSSATSAGRANLVPTSACADPRLNCARSACATRSRGTRTHRRGGAPPGASSATVLAKSAV